MSVVLREWNDLEAAVRYAREGLELGKQWGQVAVLLHGYGEVARALQAIGDMDGALEAIQKARHITSDVSTWFVARASSWDARLRLAQGDVAAASRWAQESGLGVDDELSFQRYEEYLTFARFRVAQGRVDEALRLLARLLNVAETAGATGYMIEILVLKAMAHQIQGEMEQAITALERALTLAEPEGYVRTFIDEGSSMGKLLRQATARGIALGYVGKLLTALEKGTKGKRHLGKAFPASMVEPLSKRELEVLRLLKTHLSSTDIADELTISVNTVRTHIKSIYSKLNVHSRQDAVQKAQELELL
jgi:LuxR family maltose regulon positive regulatory protein